nr:hypothetical protein [Amanita phalloides]
MEKIINMIYKSFSFLFFNLFTTKEEEESKNEETESNLSKKLEVNINSIHFNRKYSEELGPYLSGLIEGDGTFAIHNINSTTKKYGPKIIIVFKKADLPLANYLCELTQCGKVYIKSNRGYILWQISDLIGVFKIICIINGHMRTPKYEALERAINWYNLYIDKNKESKLPITQKILSSIYPLNCLPLDNSEIYSNSWLAGFTDADGNFSINIQKRKNKNTSRVQPYFRIEVSKNYAKKSLAEGEKFSNYFFMSKIATFFDVTLYSRNRTIKDKVFFTFSFMASNKRSLDIARNYFNKFSLLSSKYLDYLDWFKIVEIRKNSYQTSSYLDLAIKIRKDFNKNRVTFTWNHLKNSYIENIK